MCEALSIQVRQQPGHVLVVLAGEVDIATVGRLRECLVKQAASGLPQIIDLDQVTFMDATGLGVLVGAARRVAAHGASLYVVCAQPRIRKLFRLTGLERCLRVAGTQAEALAALDPRHRGTPLAE